MHRHPWRCAACVVSLVVVGSAPLVALPAAAAPAPPRALLITPTGLDFGEAYVGETTPAQQVVVTNVSAAPVDVSSLTVGAITVTPPTADPSQFSTGTTTCSGSLPAGASCTVPFLFTPKDPIGPPVDGQTTVTVNGQTADVHLTGTGLEPFLLSPTGIDFGTLAVGARSAGQSVIVTNVSTTTRNISLLGAAPAAPFAFDGATSTCGVGPLAPEASCQVDYLFLPTAAGSFTQTVYLQVSGRPFDVTLAGRAAETVERVWLNPTAVDFGTRFVGLPGSPTLGGTVQVVGSASYTITSITGPSNPEFQRFIPPSASCQVGMQLSATGQQPFPACGLLYTYTPGDWGPPDTATVTVVLDDSAGRTSTLTLTLAGSSKRPFLVTPIGFDFGDVALGATAPGQAATVRNVTGAGQGTQAQGTLADGSGWALLVSALGVPAPPFGGTTDCNAVSLPPGATCTIGYAFTPAAFGPATAEAQGEIEYHLPLNGAAASPGASVVPQQNGTAPVQAFSIALEGVARDDVPPTITVAVAPPSPAATGWYNIATGAPTVSFTCSDPAPASGIASCTAPTTLATRATPQAVVGTAVDVAGNSASVTSPALRVDLVAPKLTCPATPTFVQGATGAITATLSDAESGVATATVSVPANTSTPGSKTATVSGTDVAGNTVTASCPYVVTPAVLPPTGADRTGLLLTATGLLLIGVLALAGSRRTIRG